MAHPYSTYPDICKEDTGNFDTPTTAIQDDGWPDSSVPAAKHFNWFAHWTSKWVNYLAGLVPDTLATSLAQIITNTADIATNVSDIATNAANISSNDTDIATNASNIATNTANISSNDTDIATNASNIATNAANISSNDTDIAANASDISSLHNSGVLPVFYTPTDVYLTSDDPGVTPVLVDITFTAFNGLVFCTWDNATITMGSTNSTYVMYLTKDVSNWESFVIPHDTTYPTKFVIPVICGGQYCVGEISMPRSVDYGNTLHRMYISISMPDTISSETYSHLRGNYFRDSAGIGQSAVTYKTSIVTP